MELEENKIRPTFLTVLCILTFVASGWSVLTNTISFVTGSVFSTAETEILSDVRDQMDEDLDDLDDEEAEVAVGFIDSIFGQVEEIAMYKVELAANTLILSIVLVLGAFFMFKMEKRGYYLYVFGSILQIVAPIIFAGFIPMLFYPTLFINLLFILLYSTQVKHLS